MGLPFCLGGGDEYIADIYLLHACMLAGLDREALPLTHLLAHAITILEAVTKLMKGVDVAEPHRTGA